MIDRYIISAEKDAIRNRYNISHDFDFTATFNAKPTDKLPVIFNKDPKIIQNTYWGQTPEWSNNKKLSTKLFNAPVDETRTKKSLAIGLQNRRCLIPATGFVVWNKLGKKTAVPYLYHLPMFEIFTMAGIWEDFSNIDGEGYLTFKLITRTDEKLQVNAPLMLSLDDELDWLSGNKETESLMKNSRDDFNTYSISPVIHKTQKDTEELIKHIPPVDQQGNYTLFS